MINVDAIYIIALPERKGLIEYEMKRYGIDHILFPAIQKESGIAGLQESVAGIFMQSLIDGHKNVLIIEDDAEIVVGNPIGAMNRCISELPFDYDCLQFGTNMVAKPIRYSENLFKVNYTHSTHAVLYSKKAIIHILSILDYQTHLDTLIHKYLQPLGNCYCSDKIIINQRDGYSYIEKRNMKYGTIMRDKFEVLTKGV